MNIQNWVVSAVRRFGAAPVAVTFVASLLLSLIAVVGEVTVGKDAAFYLSIAQNLSDHGFSGVFSQFNWPGFLVLLAGTHNVLGIPMEQIAYLWCALFMGGACALLVDCVRRVRPEATWWAVLVVLCVPAFNESRGEILREFGFWFATALTLWLAVIWQQRGGWWRATAIYFAIALAVLFRLEALILLPALFLWQLPRLNQRAGWIGLAQLAALPLLVMLLLGGFLLESGQASKRVAFYLQLIDPAALHTVISAKAKALNDAVFFRYMEDMSVAILLSMMFTTVVLIFLKLCGPLIVLFFNGTAWRGISVFWQEFRLFALAALLYVVVLVIFFLQLGFINSRYTSYLHVLCIPFFSVALLLFHGRFPRLGRVLVGLLLLVALANVISTSAKKTHFVEAGAWLAEHMEQRADVYFEDARVGYYAGWGYPYSALSSEQAMSAEHQGQFNYWVVEIEADDPTLQEWLATQRAQVLARFANRKGEPVLVIGRGSQ